jgi:DNA invertase Pin-like site-specific DNA recombinase
MEGTETTSTPSAPVVPVAIYTRVSTDNQVGGRFDSCESQLAICRDFIRRNSGLGWTEVGHYTDPAVSGSSMNRPGLQAMMRHIEAGGVKVILIFKLERMSRNIDEFGPFRSFLRKHGCRLESATEDISESTPSGRLKNNLMLSFSQYEKENTAEKTQVKMLQQAKRGYWNGGAVPYGYDYDKNTQTLKPHPNEAAVVRRVFEQAAQLVSMEEVADALNREGLRTRARVFRRTDGTERTIGQRRFRSDGLRMMVTNPIYRGVIRYAGQEYPGRHEALVTSDTWEQANAAVAKFIRPAPAIKLEQDKHFHLLKGLVHCGCCHRALVPHASGKRDASGGYYRYYYCSSFVKERADAGCAVRHVAAGSLENVVIQFLSELGKHPDIISAAVGSSQTRRQVRMKDLKIGLGRVDREMAATGTRIRNCVEAMASGGKMIAEELAEEVRTLKERKQTQTVERQRLSQELAACEGEVLDEERVRSSVARFGQILQGLSRDEQKALVGAFVDRIDVRPGKDDGGADQAVSVRRLELRLKLNLPRLIEGMDERLLVTAPEKPSLKPGMVVTAQVALGQQGRANQSLILKPFRCGDEETLSPTVELKTPQTGTAEHPILQARVWQKKLLNSPGLSLRRLAEQEGEVPPTLVFRFRLLKLVPSIQNFLAGLRDPMAIRFFSLRRMMALAKLDEAEQRRGFAQMREEFDGWAAPSKSECSVALRPSQAPTNRIRIG